jgi:hypothetical protein
MFSKRIPGHGSIGGNQTVQTHAKTYRISLGICEKVAENGVLSTAPQTREPRRFKLVLASRAKLGRF